MRQSFAVESLGCGLFGGRHRRPWFAEGKLAREGMFVDEIEGMDLCCTDFRWRVLAVRGQSGCLLKRKDRCVVDTEERTGRSRKQEMINYVSEGFLG